MHTLARCSSILLTVLLVGCADNGGPLRLVESLGTGAPSMACVNMRPLHALHRPKPASASQFFVTQSALGYGVDGGGGGGGGGGGASASNEITVEIATHSSERFFRGFMVQAYDPISGRPIGQFQPGPDARPIEGCSAATHRDPHNKRKVSLVWAPAADQSAGDSADQSVSSLMSWVGRLGQGVGQANRGRQLASLPTSGQAQNATHGDGAPLKQVRFRATIVVSYSEFYTGFESSELKFKKFNYSQANEAENDSSNDSNNNNNNNSSTSN